MEQLLCAKEHPWRRKKAHLVTDLRGVNKVLKIKGHPLDGSSHILKRLNPENKFYAVCDLSMGYHQLELHPESRELFSIVLPRGKYRYACMPQGAGPSSNLFNIHTDPQLRGCIDIYKNFDDILTINPWPAGRADGLLFSSIIFSFFCCHVLFS